MQNNMAFQAVNQANFNIDAKVRKKIFEHTKTTTNISGIYKETLRAMISLFSSFRYINSENEPVKVKCIFANPERPIAKQFQENNIILPILSIEQLISNEDSTRVRYGSILVHEKFWDEDKQRAIRVLSVPSKAININYKINLWAKYRADLDQILEQIRFAFQPSLDVPTKFTSATKAYLEGEEDFGDVSIETGQDRLLKKGLNVKIESYVPSPKFQLTSTGEIEALVEVIEIEGKIVGINTQYLDKNHPKYKAS